jgi:hypothetical protein
MTKVLKKTLREACEDYNKAEGYDNSDESLYETFIEGFSKGIVQEECEHESRWYDMHSVVHKVVIDEEVRYFSTFDYHITGDNCASDMDLEMPTLKDVYEVYPEVVSVTVYK